MFRIAVAAHARGTHHKLAMHGLERLTNADRAGWQNLFLVHAETYCIGSKIPDDTFKDFKNHVLHPRDKYWGGAVDAARAWYATLVKHLRAGAWLEAVSAAGVLSHYLADPLHPFHTAQSDAENTIHRACEWSIRVPFLNFPLSKISLSLPAPLHQLSPFHWHYRLCQLCTASALNPFSSNEEQEKLPQRNQAWITPARYPFMSERGEDQPSRCIRFAQSGKQRHSLGPIVHLAINGEHDTVIDFQPHSSEIFDEVWLVTCVKQHHVRACGFHPRPGNHPAANRAFPIIKQEVAFDVTHCGTPERHRTALAPGRGRS
jgi:hypothetical protein